jgi:hypothetical protein
MRDQGTRLKELELAVKAMLDLLYEQSHVPICPACHKGVSAGEEVAGVDTPDVDSAVYHAACLRVPG